MPQGRIKFFNVRSGYGFIEPLQPGLPEVFLHSSVLEKANPPIEVERGGLIDFDIVEQADGRLRARGVRFAPARQ